MKKFLAVLVASMFAATSFTVIAQEKKSEGTKMEKKADKKPAKKAPAKKKAEKKGESK